MIAPAIVIAGTPPTLYLAIGEASNIDFLRNGKIAAAIHVMRYIVAIARVASKKITETPGTYEYRTPKTIVAMNITAIVLTGAPYFETLPIHAGNVRSKAIANIALVDERNSVPAQPQNQKDIDTISQTARMGLLKTIPARSPGYGLTGNGDADPPYMVIKNA